MRKYTYVVLCHYDGEQRPTVCGTHDEREDALNHQAHLEKVNPGVEYIVDRAWHNSGVGTPRSPSAASKPKRWAGVGLVDPSLTDDA